MGFFYRKWSDRILFTYTQRNKQTTHLLQSTEHQRVNKRPICSSFPKAVLFGKLPSCRIIPREIQTCIAQRNILPDQRGNPVALYLLYLVPCPLHPFPSLWLQANVSLSHLCLHASSSSRCVPELLNDTGDQPRNGNASRILS